MSNHTPGPWKANFAISGSVYIFGGDRNFACVFDEWRDEANQEANANLIAAAPDNYECNIELAAIVRELCAMYNHPLPQASLDRSDAALAKARGEK